MTGAIEVEEADLSLTGRLQRIAPVVGEAADRSILHDHEVADARTLPLVPALGAGLEDTFVFGVQHVTPRIDSALCIRLNGRLRS